MASNLRIPNGQYVGNTLYADSGSGRIRYCTGHKTHRPSAGGRLLGPLRQYYCAECVAERAARKLPKENDSGK